MTHKEAIKQLTAMKPIGAKCAEACDIAIEALEKAERCKWHNPMKNPNDLLVKEGLYAICVEHDFEEREIGFGQFENVYGYGSGWTATMPCFGKVIAWKEIEPYEVKE